MAIIAVDLSVGMLKEARESSDSPSDVAVVAAAVPTPRPTLYPKGHLIVERNYLRFGTGPHTGPRVNVGNFGDRRWGISAIRDMLASSARPPAGAPHLGRVHHADGLCEDVSRSNPKGPQRTSVLRFVDVFTRYHVQKEPANPRPICPLM
jgi:hypothetical protein